MQFGRFSSVITLNLNKKSLKKIGLAYIKDYLNILKYLSFIKFYILGSNENIHSYTINYMF